MPAMLDYPLKFQPILKEKIWGGKKLQDLLGKKSDSDALGESWEISGVKNDISLVENGTFKGKTINEILEQFKEDLVGEKVYNQFGTEFPLLVKFIDAKTALSVQLHPDDKLAKERHNSFGKTEMWYIMQADEDAEINIGFSRTITKDEYLEYLDNGKITELLNFEKVKKGDAYFIHPGKVHAIGAGVLLAEIQQTSDLTYRIYDWDRKDAHGNSRELHTALALDAIDFKKKDDFRLRYEKNENKSSKIVSCQYFITNYLPVKGEIEKDYSSIDSFVIYMCVGGKAEITTNQNSETIEQGQTILIPAQNNNVTIQAESAELLEVYIP
ncbi:MAG TPA: type I phosphomannose isomerase catalytic subunit [Gillisia sp.]|nr:type I phosphomannose isomerase catalytic subunit [Gillisia sp.]